MGRPKRDGERLRVEVSPVFGSCRIEVGLAIRVDLIEKEAEDEVDVPVGRGR